MDDAPATSIAVHYFDGRSARARPARACIAGDTLRIDGDGVSREVALHEVRWPERSAHGARIVHLADGATVVAADPADWDAWRRARGPREGWVVRLQQSWRAALACLVAAAVLVAAGLVWGVPWAARVAVAAMPAGIEQEIGDAALASVDERWMRPSTLPAAQQERLQAAWSRAVAALPAGSVPAHRLLFRHSRVGANAFALPGGAMILTDQLVQQVGGDEAVVVGVLGHELGHLRHRHGLRLLVEASAVGAVAGALIGDFSTLLAALPVWLAQASYSRAAEREADEQALRVLRAAGLSPLAMVAFLEAMAKAAPGRDAGGAQLALSTHPSDAQRIAFFRAAAR